jgi:Tol biopolymer transport system component
MKQLIVCRCLPVTLLFSFIVCAQNKQPNWSPAQCLRLKNITAVRPSPDGSKVLYTVREAVMTADRSEYINQVFVCNADGSNTIQLTRGDKNSSNPKWSHDGKWVAYTSNRDGKNNLYVLPLNGGESEKITDSKTGLNDFAWSADDKMIAFTMSDAENDVEEKNKKAKDDWYYLDDSVKQSRLYVLWLNDKDTAGKRIEKKLTNGNFNVNDFSWSPDDKQIVFSHGKTPLVNDQVYSDISLVDVATANAKDIIASPAGESDPIFSPDGKFIAFYSTDEKVNWAGPDHVSIYSVAENKSWSLAATPNEDGGIIGWTADSKYILWGEPSNTLYSIFELSTDGKKISEWTKETKNLLSIPYLNAKANAVGFVLQNSQQLPQAYVSSIASYNPVK